MKNYVVNNGATSTTLTSVVIANAVDSATLAASADVEKGCTINQVHVTIDICGTAGVDVNNQFDGYIMKDPGANLTPPGCTVWGTSNEKKFIFKTYSRMIMSVAEGATVFHIEGWVKIPKGYRRFGAADRLLFVQQSTVTGHINVRFLYKWYK